MDATEMDGRLGFIARLWLAIWLPWKLLFNERNAFEVKRLLQEGRRAPSLPTPAIERLPVPSPPRKPDSSAALQLLAIFQRDGRLIDFLKEDVAGIPDAQVGAAARIVHEGCRKAILNYVKFEPVRTESEGAEIAVEPGFDPTRIRLTGNVVGKPPFRGRLAHHGWKATDVSLPPLPEGHDPTIVAPAEVEL